MKERGQPRAHAALDLAVLGGVQLEMVVGYVSRLKVALRVLRP
jgi:hypothetical protein